MYNFCRRSVEVRATQPQHVQWIDVEVFPRATRRVYRPTAQIGQPPNQNITLFILHLQHNQLMKFVDSTTNLILFTAFFICQYASQKEPGSRLP